MCLAIPGRVLEIIDSSTPRMGTVEFNGVRKEVCLELLPETTVGEYVIVHVGFALSKVDEEEARATLRLLEEMDDTPDEFTSSNENIP